MSYTPINWQTGDTITAEKMNKMDNGWGVGLTQLFSETVATVADEGEPAPVATLEYDEPINASSIVVTFDNVDYTVQRMSFLPEGTYAYGEAGESGPDFTNYPFFIIAYQDDPATNKFYTATAGTYTVSVISEALQVSEDFTAAVSKAAPTNGPLQLISGVTEYDDALTAYNNGRLLYFHYTDSNTGANRTYIIHK